MKTYPLADYSLATLNTLAVDVKAKYYWPISGEAELMAALDWYQELHPELALPLLVLGGGSNIVLQDDFPGLVLHMQNHGFKVLKTGQASVRIEVQAGQIWHELVEQCCQLGYHGLENLALIPGNVGAAPIQNIGAYGVELKDSFISLKAFNLAANDFEVLNAEQCQFGYRESVFKQVGQPARVICSVVLELSLQPQLNLSYPGLQQALARFEQPSPKQLFDAVCELRRSKLPDPAELANVGSFFKNPVIDAAQLAQLQQQYPAVVNYPAANGCYKIAAGWLIDQAGWKGKRQGGVGVHQHQALVLVNFNAGSGSEILQLAKMIQQDIYAKFSISLEIEPRVY